MYFSSGKRLIAKGLRLDRWKLISIPELSVASLVLAEAGILHLTSACTNVRQLVIMCVLADCNVELVWYSAKW